MGVGGEKVELDVFVPFLKPLPEALVRVALGPFEHETILVPSSFFPCQNCRSAIESSLLTGRRSSSRSPARPRFPSPLPPLTTSSSSLNIKGFEVGSFEADEVC